MILPGFRLVVIRGTPQDFNATATRTAARAASLRVTLIHYSFVIIAQWWRLMQLSLKILQILVL